MARVPSHRASDSDRELVAERLRHATGEGRLTPDELEQRLDAVYGARTYGQLDALTADLPVDTRRSAARSGVPRWVPGAAALTLLIAVFGVLTRAVRHSAVAAGGVRTRPPSLPGPLGPFYYAHHGFMVATSAAGVFAVLVVFATVVWLVGQMRRTSDA